MLYGDHLGSASVAVDSSNNVTRMRYKAWGEARGTSASAFATDRLFTGQVYDGDVSAGGTGLYYYNARMYDPALGRFTQADAIVPEPSRPLAFDRYAYVYNNPVRYTDPSGHYTCSSHELDTWDSNYCYGVWIDPSFLQEEIWLIIRTLYDYANLLGGEQAFFDNMALDAIRPSWYMAQINNNWYDKDTRTIYWTFDKRIWLNRS